MPYKNPEKRRESQKQYTRKKRAKSKAENEKSKEREIEEHVKSGDLNFGLTYEKESFMSWEEYKALWFKHGKTPNFKQYLHDKSQFERNERSEPLRIEGEKHWKIPIYDHECEETRKKIMNGKRSDSDVLLHMANCDLCNRWYATYKKEFIDTWKGCNLFDSEPKPTSKEESELNKKLYEETFK